MENTKPSLAVFVKASESLHFISWHDIKLLPDTDLRKDALAIVTVISVLFVGDGRLSSGAFVYNSCSSSLSLSLAIKKCCPHPIASDESLMPSNFIARPVVDWSVPAAQFKAIFSDGISGLGHRMGIRLLNMICHDLRASSVPKTIELARVLLCCYESSIHLCVRQLRIEQNQVENVDAVDALNFRKERLPISATLKILHNYELMISHLMEKVASDKEMNSGVPAVRDYKGLQKGYCAPAFKIKSHDEVYNESGESHILIIGKTINAIADDISHWAANLPDDEDMLWKIRNLLLPYLLRLLSHCVVCLGAASAQELPSDTVLRKDALAIVTVVSVPFVGDGRLSSGAFGIGSLLECILPLNSVDRESTTVVDPLSLSLAIKKCRPYPITFDESLMPSNFIARPVVDWSVPAAQFKATWSDGISGIGHRMGIRLLNMICHDLRAKKWDSFYKHRSSR
ncbi:LOW QUALITY PROTEIN: hypothetical protein ACHAWX_003204 [Stephanocyclus meneghinianus]